MSSQYDVLAAGSRAAAQKKRLKLTLMMESTRASMMMPILEVVEVLRMFYQRQNTILELYFASGIMGVIGTGSIATFQIDIEPTVKSAMGSL